MAILKYTVFFGTHCFNANFEFNCFPYAGSQNGSLPLIKLQYIGRLISLRELIITVWVRAPNNPESLESTHYLTFLASAQSTQYKFNGLITPFLFSGNNIAHCTVFGGGQKWEDASLDWPFVMYFVNMCLPTCNLMVLLIHDFHRRGLATITHTITCDVIRAAHLAVWEVSKSSAPSGTKLRGRGVKSWMASAWQLLSCADCQGEHKAGAPGIGSMRWELCHCHLCI